MAEMASSSSSSWRPLAVMRMACRSSSHEKGNHSHCWSAFALSKPPSLVVRSESNVWKDVRKKPHPACVICEGSGRVDCHHCRGRGRTNCVDLTMLPKGEWPKWCTSFGRCRTCGGSGLDYCNRCLRTGEYRDVMGFHFMTMNTDST